MSNRRQQIEAEIDQALEDARAIEQDWPFLTKGTEDRLRSLETELDAIADEEPGEGTNGW